MTMFRGVLSLAQICLRHHSCILSALGRLWADPTSLKSVKRGEENVALKGWGYLRRNMRRLVTSDPTSAILEVTVPCSSSPFPRTWVLILLSCWQYCRLVALTWGPEELYLALGHTPSEQLHMVGDWLTVENEIHAPHSSLQPLPNSGQLRMAASTPELLIGSAEAFVATKLQFYFLPNF